MKMEKLLKFLSVALALPFLVSLDRAVAAAPIKVRLATLAPKGSSYTKHIQTMGEAWRRAPGGGVLLTIYPDGTMGSEADMVRRMRLNQLQAAMVTTDSADPDQNEPSLISQMATTVWESASRMRVSTLARPARGPKWNTATLGCGFFAAKT